MQGTSKPISFSNFNWRNLGMAWWKSSSDKRSNASIENVRFSKSENIAKVQSWISWPVGVFVYFDKLYLKELY